MDNRGSSRNDPIGSASWFIGRSADSQLLQNVRLHRLLLYVEYHLSEPLSLAMAAEIVGLERTYFSRFFRNAIGQTFFEWNQEIRMQRAKTLLRRKDWTCPASVDGLSSQHKSFVGADFSFRKGQSCGAVLGSAAASGGFSSALGKTDRIGRRRSGDRDRPLGLGTPAFELHERCSDIVSGPHTFA